jgi:hypothetical protein
MRRVWACLRDQHPLALFGILITSALIIIMTVLFNGMGYHNDAALLNLVLDLVFLSFTIWWAWVTFDDGGSDLKKPFILNRCSLYFLCGMLSWETVAQPTEARD